jgi:ABC-type polysaccharide/polyol phosphate transport system ATPase subunit
MMLLSGFSVDVKVDLDVLIIDEVLALDDPEYQAKCYERIQLSGGRERRMWAYRTIRKCPGHCVIVRCGSITAK